MDLMEADKNFKEIGKMKGQKDGGGNSKKCIRNNYDKDN